MINISQVKFENLDISIDYLIVSSGYESRAIFQSEKIYQLAKEKICLGFNNEVEDSIRVYNDNIFKNLGFKNIHINGEDSINSELQKILDGIEYSIQLYNEVVVYIDYSCMTKNWYSYLLFSLNCLENKERLKLFFGYSHAHFIPNDDFETYNRVVKPLFGYCNLSLPSKPTALIIGLGNEPNRVYGLKEYFDAVPYLFYSDISYNKQYHEEIKELHSKLLGNIPSENIFTFPIHDLIYTYYILENLSKSLLLDYRVIIAPCGPKVFGLLAMLISLNHDQCLEVWRISPGAKIQKIDRKPTGLISLLEVKL